MLIIDTHIHSQKHTNQPLKLWLSNSGDLETCKSIKIYISKIFYHTCVRESNKNDDPENLSNYYAKVFNF